MQFGSPKLRDDGRWYWSYNSGLQPQSSLSSPSLIVSCLIRLEKQFIIAQKIQSSPMLFLAPVAKYFLTYVRKRHPVVYAHHLPASAKRTFKRRLCFSEYRILLA